MSRKSHPEFHKALLDQATYPAAPRHIRYTETRLSHLYRTGAELYKLRKPSQIFSSLAVNEVLVREALARGRRWAPQVMIGMAQVVAIGGGVDATGTAAPSVYKLAAMPELPDAVGALPLAPAPADARVVEYALRMKQLSENSWVDALVRNGKLTDVSIGRIARFLAQRHAECPADEKAVGMGAGRPEKMLGLAEDLLFQAKQFLGEPLTAPLTTPMFELMARPLNRFIAEGHKLLLRRIKKGRLVHCHGAFVPEHIFVKSLDVQAVSPVLSQSKFHLMDAAADVAVFVNGLLLLDAAAPARLFQARYATAAKDRDLGDVLPFYQVLMALRRGITASEAQRDATLPDELRETFRAAAHSHFALGVDVARTMTRASAAMP